MKRRVVSLALVAWLVVGLLSGAVSALTVNSVALEYSHDMGWKNYTKLYQLDANGSIVPALYRGDEASLPSYLDATLFCPLDDINSDNTTTCYYKGQIVNETVVGIENITLVQGHILNAFNIIGNNVYMTIDVTDTAQSLSFAITVDDISFEAGYGVLFHIWNADEAIYFKLYSDGTVALRVKNATTSAVEELSADFTLDLAKRWLIGFNYNTNTNAVTFFAYDGSQLLKSTKQFTSVSLSHITLTNIRLFEHTMGYQLKGIFDEARIYKDKFVTDDKIKLLYHINRHKTAVLSAPGATFNGTHFLVNVTAQLPNDGGSYLLPAPINAISSYTSVGSIGNFTLLNVGTASTASFQIPAKPGEAVPGLKGIGFETSEGLYAYGAGSTTLTNPTTTLYLATNTISGGKVTDVAWSGVSTLKKLDVPLTVQGGTGVITVNKVTPELIDLTAQSITTPVKISARNLLPYADYNVLHDDNKVATFTPDDQGVASFEITAAGTWLIGVTEALWDSIGSNVIAITTTVLIIAIFAMMVVERTPAKFDDNVMKALLAMLALAIVAGLIKLILLLQ